MQHYTVYFIWKRLYMFRVVPSTIIRSANNCIYIIWYLSHRYCYLRLLWKSWNWFKCAVGSVCHPQHTQTSSDEGFGGETWGKETTGGPSCRWDYNVKMEIHEVGCGGMDWIELAQDRYRRRALVNAVMNLRVP
jgi:hypothetical protein